ncbi:Protein spire 2, partial [Eschrichtius robustus]|nr:Protein spire 2 [Eschrichtius robustus]
VNGDIPPRVKKDAHELILDFIRSRPPLKQVSERRLRPLPQKQRTLHEKILEEIKQERRLRPVEGRHWDGRGFGSLPCILNACSGDVKSSSCINLSVTDAGSSAQRPRPRVLLKAPTLAEMEEMNISEEFSHPVESLALTVEEVMDVRRVLVKAEMEKFLQNKELFSSLKKGKICCCCRTKFPLFSWPPTCLFCKRAVCSSCNIKMKMPSKKFAHIPVRQRLLGPMSRRALRRLRGEQRGQEPLGPGALQFVLHDDDDVEEEGPKRGPVTVDSRTLVIFMFDAQFCWQQEPDPGFAFTNAFGNRPVAPNASEEEKDTSDLCFTKHWGCSGDAHFQERRGTPTSPASYLDGGRGPSSTRYGGKAFVPELM